jgi:hypothetical protein
MRLSIRSDKTWSTPAVFDGWVVPHKYFSALPVLDEIWTVLWIGRGRDSWEALHANARMMLKRLSADPECLYRHPLYIYSPHSPICTASRPTSPPFYNIVIIPYVRSGLRVMNLVSNYAAIDRIAALEAGTLRERGRARCPKGSPDAPVRCRGWIALPVEIAARTASEPKAGLRVRRSCVRPVPRIPARECRPAARDAAGVFLAKGQRGCS